MSESPRAVYIHVPFCRHRCGYCNFTVVAGHADVQAQYLAALETELACFEDRYEVDTVYFGGGTPTELTPPRLEQLCWLVQSRFQIAEPCEWSIEANPKTLTREAVERLAEAGVNRISLGAQSFEPAKLQLLEREHTSDDIAATFQLCREYFASISLDLIFAVPGESLAQWQADLASAMALQPDHISLYGLTFEKGARFWGELQRGLLVDIEEELQRAMYEMAIDTLVSHGWEHYEVSNFARPGHRCRHNETYWTGREYFAAGAGASRYVQGRHETNHRSTFTYMRRLQQGLSPVAEAETLSPEERAREQLIFGLRMLAGVDRQDFCRQTGFAIDDLVAEPLRDYLELGLLQESQGRLRLTRQGLLVSDALWPAFL